MHIGYLGRLHPKKNVDTILRALAALPKVVRLVIGGSGDSDYTHEIRALAAELGVSARIEWRGHLGPRRRAEFFDDVRIVLMPSEYESFGMIAAEALAAGVPTIVSDMVGVAPIVREFGAGRVVAAGDSSQLAEAVSDLLANGGPSRDMRLRAAAAAVASFSFQAYGEAITKAYTELTTPAAELADPLSAKLRRAWR